MSVTRRDKQQTMETHENQSIDSCSNTGVCKINRVFVVVCCSKTNGITTTNNNNNTVYFANTGMSFKRNGVATVISSWHASQHHNHTVIVSGCMIIIVRVIIIGVGIVIIVVLIVVTVVITVIVINIVVVIAVGVIF